MNHAAYPVSDLFRKKARINKDQYEELYKQSLEDSDLFWRKQGKRLDWIRSYQKVKNTSFKKGTFGIKWYEDGTLNACVNCVDRHLLARADKIALIWEGDDPKDSKTFTYRKLFQEVCYFANVLKKLNIQRGDRVTLYMPMIPEAVFAMLACARIGAIHSVVFGGFSAAALAGRIDDCKSKLVITADEGLRGGKKIPLKKNVDEALLLTQSKAVKNVLVVRRTGEEVPFKSPCDVWYHDLKETVSDHCEPEEMFAEDSLFILYTSGSTGKPKGVLHTTGGYLVYTSYTHEIIFDHREEDVFWCTADVGWITGHSYSVYGPLSNGATVVLFEGIPTYPDASRFWQVVDKHKVSVFYTAPTAIRSLMREGAQPVWSTNRSSLRLLGTVGEPINPEAWEWYYEIVGDERCPIVDTWWQTETGGILLTPLPGATPLKPGAASWPFFGIIPAIVNEKGEILKGEAEGSLVILDSWPGQMRTVFRNEQRFFETYFTTFPGMYFTGDGAKRDKDGYYWITGRVDDVINVSGHRLGTAEIEAVLDEHPLVVESAVVGFPHEIKGQGIYAYVTLRKEAEPNDQMREELLKLVRKEIGPIALPDHIQWVPALPKTRSGKIMRRILRKIASNELDQLGDISTLADPQVVDDLIKNKKAS